MKIAIFSDTFLPSLNGVANTVYHSAKTLCGRGHEVCIFTVSKDSKKNFSQKTEGKLSVIILPSIPAGVYSGERLALSFGAAFRRLKNFSPDVIHIHTPFAVGWEAIAIAKILKTPIVGTHHTFYDHYLKHIKADYNWMKKFSWKYTAAFYNRCDLIISPTKSLADTLLAQGLKKPIETLQNLIDTDLFRPAPSEEIKIKNKQVYGIEELSLVYEGRVSYEKNIHQVIQAFALVLKKKPRIKLMIIGDGPEKNKLMKLAADLKINKKIIFTGFLTGDALIKAFQANDIFVTASKSENMPLSVLEGMAIGLPVVTVPEKGFNDIIKDGVNGFLVKTDSPRAMADKILELAQKPKLLTNLSAGARAMAMNYSKDSVAAMLEKSYEKVIHKIYLKNI